MLQRRLLYAIFLMLPLSSLSAQGWEAVQAEKFDGSGFSTNLDGVPGFHAVGFVRSTYGSSGAATDTCALLQPYAAGSLAAMKTDLETGFEYRIQLNTKSFGQGQSVRFSFHNAPSSGGAAAGPDIPLPSLGADDPSLPGIGVSSAAFATDAAGTYWVVAQAQGDSPGGWARYDDMALERRRVEDGPLVSFQTDSLQLFAGLSSQVCLSISQAPADELLVDIVLVGDGLPHFNSLISPLNITFPAGDVSERCFLLSPSVDSSSVAYSFRVDGAEAGAIPELVVHVAPCPGIAGPDRTVCEGETVQLGTGCLPAPHPKDGVDYCYRWEPADGLNGPAAAKVYVDTLPVTEGAAVDNTAVGNLLALDDTPYAPVGPCTHSEPVVGVSPSGMPVWVESGARVTFNVVQV